MDRVEFIEKMIAKGKITQKQHDTLKVKEAKIKEAKANYKSQKSKLKKADLELLLDELTSR